MTTDWGNNEDIKLFQEYLRIPSVHPDVDYEPCVEFLCRQAKLIGLSCNVYSPGGPRKPIVVLTWNGTDPILPGIVLNSHMDVVPVYAENWTHSPFSADIDVEGRIFARGAQDMKCVGIQYLLAVKSLKTDGIQPKRNVYLIFMPDEEIGGVLGMKKFVHTDEFKALNIGFSLDEGMASETDEFPVFYAERTIWRVEFKCNGQAGHGSLLLKNTPGEKVQYIMSKFMEFRKQEVEKLNNNPELTVGDVTTVNLTMLNGGNQSNVVPPFMSFIFDIRMAIDVDHEEFENKMKKWCEEAGGDIEMIYEQKDPFIKPTCIDDSNPFWLALKSVLVDDLHFKIKTRVFPGGTDSRYIRHVGISAIGFSPINNTPILLHDNDEFLRAETFLNGIQYYKKIIPKIANV